MSDKLIARMVLEKLIDPPLWNSRVATEKADIGELVDSIEAAGKVEQAIKVREKGDGRFFLIIGSRRLAAVRKLGWTEIPAIIEPAIKDDAQALQVAVIDNVTENLSRKNLSPYETARAFNTLRETGVKLAEMQKLTGYSQAYISNMVTIFTKISPKILTAWQGQRVKDAVKDEEAPPDILTINMLREWANLSDHAKQELLWEDAIRQRNAPPATDDATTSDGADEPTTQSEKKFHVPVKAYKKLVRQIKRAELGAKVNKELALAALAYLVGEGDSIPGVIEPEPEDEEDDEK